MKKVVKIIIAVLLITFSANAEECESSLWNTFAEYEIYCWKHGYEPSYEQYEYLYQNGICISDEGEPTLEELEN